MIIRGIIITNQDVGHNDYKIKRIIEEAKKMHVYIYTFANDGALAHIEGDEVRIHLPKVDFVLYFDKDLYLATLLEKAGYRVFNSAKFMKICDDKMLTYVHCMNDGIRCPKTYAAPLIYGDELKESNLKFLDLIDKEFTYPMIVKKNYGSLGEGVYKVHDKDELINTYKEHFKEPLMFQENIESSNGRSIRVMVINRKVIGAFERNNPDDFRSNFGENAASKELVLENNYYDFASHIAKTLDIEYAGIDLLYGDDGYPYLCEINSNAFFEEFEKVTRINVAQKYLDYIVETVNNSKAKGVN